MVVTKSGPSQLDRSAFDRRTAAGAGPGGPAALLKNLRVFGIAAFACIGGLLYGYNQGVFSGVLTMNNFNQHMGEYTIDQTKKGWLTSILELGAWFGTLMAGFLAESISRKYAILVNSGIFIVGVIIQCTATTASGSSSILAGRFIVGISIGSLSMIVPMYVAECSPPEVRGLMVALQQLAIEFGILISFWIDYGCNYIGGVGDTQSAAAWLIPLTLQLAPAIILLIGMIFMPFSPRWLVHHNREAEARKVLATLRGLPQDSELVEVEFLEIKAQSLFEKRTVADHFPHLREPTVWNTFKQASMGRYRISVQDETYVQTSHRGYCNDVFSAMDRYQCCAIFDLSRLNVKSVELGLSSNTVSLLATGVVGIVMFIATIPSMLYIDKLGRKPVLALGAICMAFCHLTIAIIFAKNVDQWQTQKAAGWAAVAMVWFFVFNFGWSWGPCAWILVAEVWPLSARPYGIALGASSNWMNNFIVGQVTPDMLTTMGYGTYIFFGIITLVGAAFIWFYVPETSLLSLEEMDGIFGSSGIAVADQERMKAINVEIGLDDLLNGGHRAGSKEKDVDSLDEKGHRMVHNELNASDELRE
ncbi:hypothetical protein MMC18_002585 [Xylographa bjoerkii]|nr:hypothetical protein [Xylographa bjoerkii]